MIETIRIELPHGITLSCRAAGRGDAPLLVFVHGFPEAAFVWDGLLEHFAGRWRCVAPNLRGYAGSSAPAGVDAYKPKHLVADLAALIDALGGRAAAVVAHDWGGALAWNLAATQPRVLDRLVIVNAPHPAVFLRALQSDPAQQAASAYMNFLRRPDAEALLAENDFARLWRFFTAPGEPRAGAGWLDEATKERYREVWRTSLRGGCNYYRASPLHPPTPGDTSLAALRFPDELVTVGVPTRVVWAEDDRALPVGLLDGLEAYVRDLRVVRIPGATHWIVHEQPERVAAEIEQALQDGAGAPS